MTTVLLVIHLLIAVALVSVVLMQKSEGGALGGGGGGGGGGFLTGRGTANLLTRTTAGLALAFFLTSILLSLSSGRTSDGGSVFDRAPATPAGQSQPAKPNAGGILDDLKSGRGLTTRPEAPSGN